MKRVTKLALSLSLLSPLFMSASTSFDGKAYDDTEKLNLNNLSEGEVLSYYQNVDFSKSQDNLKMSLYDTISKNNYFLTYGSGGKNATGVSRWLRVTDRNYSLSSSIDVDTYKFKDDTDFYLVNLYFESSANNDKNKAINNFKSYKDINNNIQVDKEHIWAKNHGFKHVVNGNDTFPNGASVDLHHLVAADHNTNSAGHNDYFYGNVPNKEDAQKIYCYYADGTTALSGYLFKGETRYDNIFEPLDEWKGNIARALFYMATRYGKRNEVNTQEEPYLYFSNEDVFNTDEDFVGTQRYLDTLLDWDKIDPVDDYEIKRNNLIFNNVQRNRNPFVDIQNLSSAVFKNEVLSEVKINVQGQTPTPVDPIKPEEPEEKKDIPVWIIILIVVGVLLVASTVIGIGVTKSRKKRR